MSHYEVEYTSKAASNEWCYDGTYTNLEEAVEYALKEAKETTTMVHRVVRVEKVEMVVFQPNMNVEGY